ncbi:hypothetical protein TYRP_003654 [Tyrophagus putrescentiae]|nr:hypothetical protein TYRP_003654 [Tyrophagus putrescentiae]
MAKTTYQFILLALVILEVSRQCSSPVEAGPSKFGLYPSVAVTPPSSTSSSPTKTATRTVPVPTGGTCRKIFVGGRFCDCHDGYIFLEGVAGDCVRPEDCPKQQANSTTVAN